MGASEGSRVTSYSVFTKGLLIIYIFHTTEKRHCRKFGLECLYLGARLGLGTVMFFNVSYFETSLKLMKILCGKYSVQICVPRTDDTLGSAISGVNIPIF